MRTVTSDCDDNDDVTAGLTNFGSRIGGVTNSDRFLWLLSVQVCTFLYVSIEDNAWTKGDLTIKSLFCLFSYHIIYQVI